MSLRELPAVEKLLGQAGRLIAAYGRPLTTAVVREVVDEARSQLKAGAAPAATDWLAAAEARLAALTTPTLRPVINASGVILHTNLGRAPLSEAAVAAIAAASQGYTPLEYDLAKGERGSRTVHAEQLLLRLTGAEAALVVNNCASALLLSLAALARGKKVLVSRGQLVEIGGGFRVPDVMRQSGARLAEVGTTNRTHLRDFQEALDDQTALILRAHPSNFKIIGFTAEPALAELCGLGRPVLDDLGSGALLDTAAFGLAHEPMVQESLAAGAAAVVFSGDKLLGGPQAGIIVGRAELLTRIKKHPLARAVRADKVTLAALAATLLHYLKDEAVRAVPLWRMLAAPLDELERRAETWRAALGRGEVIAGDSTIGGGSLPGETLPTRLLALPVKSPQAAAARLRAQAVPVVARVAEGRLLLDPRTVAPAEDALLVAQVRAGLGLAG